MNLGILNTLHEDAGLVDVPDDVLLSQIEARLPRYLLERARARSPIVLAGLAIWGLAAFGVSNSDSSTTPALAAPTTVATSSEPSTSTARPSPATPTTGTPRPVGLQPAPSIAPPSLSPTAASTVPERAAAAGSLAISDSGYSSSTGGTPLEQEPPNGSLPVASLGGQHLKRSFLHLSGNGHVLHLALEQRASNTNADTATVDACAITGPWTPKRAVAASDGPTFDASRCVPGTRNPDGTWTFDLAKLPGGATQPNGIMLVPAAGSMTTFNIAFSNVALP
ncbi:MAG: hypothetical protein QOC92_286 [Acidimicrobiaceae bacterium]